MRTIRRTRRRDDWPGRKLPGRDSGVGLWDSQRRIGGSNNFTCRTASSADCIAGHIVRSSAIKVKCAAYSLLVMMAHTQYRTPADVRNWPIDTIHLIYDVCGRTVRLWRVIRRGRRNVAVELPIRIERSQR
jgi:hypothetical protein